MTITAPRVAGMGDWPCGSGHLVGELMEVPSLLLPRLPMLMAAATIMIIAPSADSAPTSAATSTAAPPPVPPQAPKDAASTVLPSGALRRKLAWAPRPPAIEARAARHVSGEVLVRYRAEATTAEIERIERRFGLRRRKELKPLRIRHYVLPPGKTVLEAIQDLEALASVEYASPNHLISIEAVPSDAFFHDQWSLHNLGQIVNGQGGPADVDIDWPEAMDLFQPVRETVVAVLDSGVALLHPDLEANILINSPEFVGDVHDGVDDDGNGFVDDFVGWDFVDDDNLPLDENGHGSLVASLIGASANDGVGVAGTSPALRMLPLRVFDDLGSGTVDAFLEASIYAVGRGARVLNFSGGHIGTNETESTLIAWLDEQGVLLVAAAGNGGADLLGDDNDLFPIFPASHLGENVVSVAATGRDDALTVFSNFGAQSVDLAAPGKDILGADIARNRVFLEDFETGAPGWTVADSCHDASCFVWSLFLDAFHNTWANDSADSLGRPVDYLRNTNAWVASPPITLPAFGPLLSFRAWHALSLTDLGFAEIESGGNWRTLEILEGFSDTAPPGTAADAGGTISADLSPFAGETVRLRFRLHSDHSFQADGFYVDDVTVSEVDVFEFDGRQFRFGSGTSFAAPLVSGVAALVWSQRPDLTHREVRQILLESVDPVSELEGRLATGGRVNASRALDQAIHFVPEPRLAPALISGLGVMSGLARRRRLRMQ